MKRFKELFKMILIIFLASFFIMFIAVNCVYIVIK